MPDDDIEVPTADRQEQQLPLPPEDRRLDEVDPEADPADQLDQATLVPSEEDDDWIDPSDETDGGI